MNDEMMKPPPLPELVRPSSGSIGTVPFGGRLAVLFFCAAAFLGSPAAAGAGDGESTPEIFTAPRLLFTPEELPGLHRKISQARLRPVWENVLADARDFCDPESPRYVTPEWVAEIPGAWLLMHGRNVADRLETIGFAYQMTGDEKLGRHGALLLETVARELPVTHPKIARGRVLQGARGDMLRVLATGCDWLGAAMNDEQRETVRRAALDYLNEVYDEVAPEGNVMGPYHNYNGVVMGAAGSLAIQFFDTKPEMAERVIDLSVKVIRNWLDRSIDEKGAYLEGTSYPSYGFFNVLFFAEGLKRIGRGNLLDHPHLRRLPYFYAMSLLPGEGVFDARNSAFYESSIRLPMLKFAQEFDDGVARWLADHTDGILADSPWRLLYENEVKPVDPAAAGAPLAEHFEQRGLVIFRTGWEAADLKFSIEAGPYYPITHNEADEGHFTLYGLGYRWAIDSGSRQSLTHAHNSVLVNGIGQSISGRSYGTSGKMLTYRDVETHGYARADLTEAYRENNAGVPAVPLQRAIRNAFWIKPSGEAPAYAVVLDDMHKDGEAHRFSWLLQASSEMEVAYEDNVARIRPVPAYDNQYLNTPAGATGGGGALLRIRIDDPGEYRVWARVRGTREPPGPPSQTGSFHVQVNEEPEFAWRIPSAFLYEWFWAPLRSPETPAPDLPADLGDNLHDNIRGGDPAILREMGRTWHTWKTLRRFYRKRDYLATTFDLTAGENTIRFRTREPDTHLDRVVLFRGEGEPPFDFDDPSLIVVDVAGAEMEEPMERIEIDSKPLPRMAVHLHAANGIVFSEDTFQFHPRVWAETVAANPRFAAVLLPLPAETDEPAVRFSEETNGLRVSIEWPDRKDILFWPSDPEREAEFDQKR